MIDFPMTDWLDAETCTSWLARHLHPEGLTCPRCGSADRRRCRAQGHFPAYRCRRCAGDDPLVTGTVLAKTHQPPVTLLLLRRGVAKGEPTARLARELKVSRQQLHPWRQRIHAHLNETAPTPVMPGTACEADERDPNAGEQQHAHRDPEVRPGGVPISGERMGRSPTIVRPWSVSSLGTQVSHASGAATMPTRVCVPA